MKRVVVGLSGGVDSSVAAHLLIEQGYEVIGLFMKNWHDDSVTISNDCPWEEDSNDALLVAEKLNIPFQTIDLSVEYKERIVDYMFAEYKAGRTPNPDVLCNREIKFDTFLKAAMRLNADFVATGHYCRKDTIEVDGVETHRLLGGADGNKDQSYFLCQLNQEQLAKALFPIGELEKPEVRRIAAEQNLVTAEKKDSQGLCFIGKVRLPDFLQQQLEPKKGQVIEIAADAALYAEHKAVLAGTEGDTEILHSLAEPFHYSPDFGIYKGDHNGAHYYTIGQRKGLGIGGTPLPLFVISTDVKSNTVYMGQGENHPGLFRKALQILPDDIHWVRPDLALQLGESREYELRIRYRQALEKGVIHMTPDGLYIEFCEPQKSIAAGQFAAWYHRDELIGSGVIFA
jgi:tRNA-specific 2-thiouridylase